MPYKGYKDIEKRRKYLREYQREWKKRNPERRAKWKSSNNSYAQRPGYRPASFKDFDYDEAEKQQGGVCAICGGSDGTKRLAVDHCHSTGSIRGLLCSRCNLGLGCFGDSPERLAAAIQYLIRTSIRPDGAGENYQEE